MCLVLTLKTCFSDHGIQSVTYILEELHRHPATRLEQYTICTNNFLHKITTQPTLSSWLTVRTPFSVLINIHFAAISSQIFPLLVTVLCPT